MGLFSLATVFEGMRHDAPIRPKFANEVEKLRLSKEKYLAEQELVRKKQNGLKLFTFGEFEIWALNEKNALRKARNAKYKRRIEW